MVAEGCTRKGRGSGICKEEGALSWRLGLLYVLELGGEQGGGATQIVTQKRGARRGCTRRRRQAKGGGLRGQNCVGGGGAALRKRGMCPQQHRARKTTREEDTNGRKGRRHRHTCASGAAALPPLQRPNNAQWGGEIAVYMCVEEAGSRRRTSRAQTPLGSGGQWATGCGQPLLQSCPLLAAPLIVRCTDRGAETAQGGAEEGRQGNQSISQSIGVQGGCCIWMEGGLGWEGREGRDKMVDVRCS